MKGVFSHAWLQTYFDEPIPDPSTVADGLNRHAFEVEAVTKAGGTTVYELDILPNRSVDCLAHRGIAHEIAAIFSLQSPRIRDLPSFTFETEDACVETERCDRYAVLTVENIALKETPPEMAALLNQIGQRSVNPIVDLSNFMLFDVGQPVHAFDAAKVSGSFRVRQARDGETLVLLSGDETTLSAEDIVIVDAANDTVIALAGIMGGEATKVDRATKAIRLEIAVFDGLAVRRTVRRLGLSTDAAQRFSQNLPPEIIDVTARYAADLFGRYGSVTASRDSRRVPIRRERVTGVSVSEVNGLLGSSYGEKDIAAAFDRLRLPYKYADPTPIFIKKIQGQVGKPYAYGASVTRDAPDRFDCSSLVCWAAAQAGKSIPRMSINQCLFADPVDDPRPGDILFTRSSDQAATLHTEATPEAGFPVTPGSVREGVNHCVIVTGPTTTVEAEGSGGENRVVEKTIESRDAVRIGRLFDGEKRFIVSVPVTRPDLRDERDLIEEIGRIAGYGDVRAGDPSSRPPGPVSATFASQSLIIRSLRTLGFSEVITSSFCKKGPIRVARSVASDKGSLRPSLRDGLERSLKQAAYYGELLGLADIRLVEVGTVFSEQGESVRLALGVCATLGRPVPDIRALEREVKGLLPIPGEFDGSVWEVALDDVVVDATQYRPHPPASSPLRYVPPSKYPFILRDIALFVPNGMTAAAAERHIRKNSGQYLRRVSLFDEFTKDGKTSYAFRLVFQSDEETLDDRAVTADMEALEEAMRRAGCTVR